MVLHGKTRKFGLIALLCLALSTGLALAQPPAGVSPREQGGASAAGTDAPPGPDDAALERARRAFRDDGHEQGEVINLAYFHNPTCRTCIPAARLISSLRRQDLQVRVHWFNFDERETAEKYAYVMKQLGLEQRTDLGPPLVIVDHTYLHGDSITRGNLSRLLEDYRSDGAPVLWDVDADALAAARAALHESVARFGAVGVALAGLIDGLNPCAFATLVFFVSYLAFLGRGRRDVLVAGLGFAFGVFAAYLAVGLGAATAVRHLAGVDVIRHGLYYVTAIVAVFFAAVSMLDYKKLREGRTGDVTLALPDGLKRRIHSTIREKTRTYGLVLGALLAGGIVSLIELGCTGQIYLPTIVGVMATPEFRPRAILWLLLYNVAFVLPLLVVLGAAQGGLSSARLGSLASRHAATAKLVMAAFFGALAVYFVYVLQSLQPMVDLYTHAH